MKTNAEKLPPLGKFYSQISRSWEVVAADGAGLTEAQAAEVLRRVECHEPTLKQREEFHRDMCLAFQSFACIGEDIRAPHFGEALERERAAIAKAAEVKP